MVWKEKPKKILFLVGRDDWKNNDNMNSRFLDAFPRREFEIVWETPIARLIYAGSRIARKWGWPGFHPGKSRTLIGKIPSKLSQMIYTFQMYGLGKTLEYRCRNLKRRILAMGVGREIVILAYSSGGRVSSLVADSLGVSLLISMGYPFQLPNAADQPARYSHLEGLKTRMLIIQGSKDGYGGITVAGRYPMSPAIELHFVDGGHSYEVTPRDRERILAVIGEAIGSLGTAQMPFGKKSRSAKSSNDLVPWPQMAKS